MRGATSADCCPSTKTVPFQSTPPMRGATFTCEICYGYGGISIHAPHAGSDTGHYQGFLACGISIHAPHAGSDPAKAETFTQAIGISIHAPHAGSDDNVAFFYGPELYFNPRPPCGERLGVKKDLDGKLIFQSTPPMRGATRNDVDMRHEQMDFNPRPPCGERHFIRH